MQKPQKFLSPKGKPMRSFSIDPTSSARTRLRTLFPRLLIAVKMTVFCSGREKGSSRCQEGGDRFFIENPKGGGFQEGEGPRGREGVCGELGNFVGRPIFFFGAETSIEMITYSHFCFGQELRNK